jgi:hypothetical protein
MKRENPPKLKLKLKPEPKPESKPELKEKEPVSFPYGCQ